MPLVHRLDVAVAAPQGDTLQHVRPPEGRGGLVAGATAISASEGEAVGGKVALGERVFLLEGQTLAVLTRRSLTRGRNPLKGHKIILSIC